MPRASQQALAPRNRLQKRLRCAVPATEFEFRGHDTPLSAPGLGSKKKGSPQHILRTASLLTTRATDCEHAKPTSQTRAVIRRRAMGGKTGVPGARTPRKRPNQENEGVPSLGSRESQLHVQPAPFRTEPSGKKSISLVVDDALNQSLCDARLQGSRALKQHPVWRGQHLQRRTSLRLQNALQKVLQQPQPPRLLQRAQMRPPFSRATKSKVSVRAQTSPRRKGKTRDTDAKQKCPSAPMSAFDDSPERLPTLTESINEKTNKWSLSEPLLLQASMLLSTLTLFLWGSWSTKFSREASQRPEISVSRDWTSPPPAAAAPTTSARAERARRRTWHIPAQRFLALCAAWWVTCGAIFYADAVFAPTSRTQLQGDGQTGSTAGVFGCIGLCGRSLETYEGYTFCSSSANGPWESGTGDPCNNADSAVPAGQGSGTYSTIGSWDVSRVDNMRFSKSPIPFDGTRGEGSRSFPSCFAPFRDLVTPPAPHRQQEPRALATDRSPAPRCGGQARPFPPPPPSSPPPAPCPRDPPNLRVPPFRTNLLSLSLTHRCLSLSPFSFLSTCTVFMHADAFNQPLGDWDVSKVTSMRSSE